jgi:hypothetical protein
LQRRERSMTPPFSAAEFFAVFSRYNQTVWPVPALLVVLAAGSVVWAVRRPARGRLVVGYLGFLWIWMAIAYHWVFFRPINPAATGFGALFMIQGLGLLWYAWRRTIALDPGNGGAGLFGWALVAYALVLYPILGTVLGHEYPAHPTFGLPCPTTIFTIGILLWVRGKVPWGLLVVPAIWSIIGFSAVRYFGVLEDAVLPLAGLVGSGAILWKGRGAGTTAA